MTRNRFLPTDEQKRAITHEGAAFIAACPGSGKTRVLVERARRLLAKPTPGRGIAFLSFTNAAISELESRMQQEGLLSTPVFPNFIGTFDSFLWTFLVAPFGVPGCSFRLRLISDKDEFKIKPYGGARELPLSCFDRSSGNAIQSRLRQYGFDGSIAAYERKARLIRSSCFERGELDFADVREVALIRLRDESVAHILFRALGARFIELFVDETQDCNPEDLEIIDCFRQTNIPIKVVCDPHQAIYGFRGGVAEELFTFRETFPEEQRLTICGNFRSNQNITRAISALRRINSHVLIDEALGINREDTTPVHILSYPGRSVPDTVGTKFHELTSAAGLKASECPVVASNRVNCGNALGHPSGQTGNHLSCRLAKAINNYHLSFEIGGRKKALEEIHKVIVEIQGIASGKTYHQYIVENEIEPNSWRPQVINIAEKLQYGKNCLDTAETWLEKARQILVPLLQEGGQSIKQRLRYVEGLGQALTYIEPTGHCARTIHSVKGMEFPAICVVMSPTKAKGILDYLKTGTPLSSSEEARKIYVGASRAQLLLVIAVPKSQALRLEKLLSTTNVITKVHSIGG
jgi:superfamily I DNA/RNA helicase